MNQRTLIAIKLIATHIVLIIGLVLFSALITKEAFLTLSITQTALVILYLAGYWEFFGLRFKRFFYLFIELLIICIFFWKVSSGTSNNINFYFMLILCLIQAFLLSQLIKIIVVIFKKESPAVEIEFPFKQGDYLITDGGNSRISRLMNYHFYSPIHNKNHTYNSMLYATDIIRINDNKSGFLPKQNELYPIFGEKVYSPMDGKVIKVENSLPDNKPFAGKYPYNTGNTVVIQKDNFFLLLGHLKKDSILVKEGDIIKANNFIGNVGNSGWTERPHLHMQLIKSYLPNYWLGQGICILYKNKIIYKNRLIKM